MYAIIKTGGKQYRVQKDDVFCVEKLEPVEDGSVNIDQVLFASDGNDHKIGTPYIENAVVKCKVVGQIKGPKIVIGKFRRRKASKRKTGHRQKITKLQVLEITAS